MQRRQTSHIKDIKSSIDQLVTGLGIRQKIAEYDAVLQWDSIVGEHVARAATAVKIVKGVLFVRVTSSAWRNELTIRKKDIVNSLNTALGGDIVKDIRFQ